MMSPESSPVRSGMGPLSGWGIDAAVASPAGEYAVGLLHRLGAGRTGSAGRVLRVAETGWVSAADDWAASGAMALTGRADGPPLPSRGVPGTVVRGALLALRALAAAWDGGGGLAGVDVRLLGERAAIAGLGRQAPWSAGGAFRIMRGSDGWVGVNLARPSDLELLPALSYGVLPGGDVPPWVELERWLAGVPVAEVTATARLLGLPVVEVAGPGGPADEQWMARWGAAGSGSVQLWEGGLRPDRGRVRPVVVDLSGLWAGPLAGHLLQLAGARIVKVEALFRPDGARRGPADFFDLINGGKEMVALDLPAPAAMDVLGRLCQVADLVIDASRPRAMEQLGVDVEALVSGGTTWVSITGFGRTGPWANQPAFGDDAAAAAGLVADDEAGPVPAGDAIADPLAGVHAAVAGLACLIGDRGWLADVSLRDVAAAALLVRPDTVNVPVEDAAPARPGARPITGHAGALGCDTAAVLDDLGIGP